MTASSKSSRLDIPVTTDAIGLYELIDQLHNRIPKKNRYTIWKSVNDTTLALLSRITKTSYLPSDQKRSSLTACIAQVDTLRLLIRICYKIQALSAKDHSDLQQKIDTIGRMLGGWVKVTNR